MQAVRCEGVKTGVSDVLVSVRDDAYECPPLLAWRCAPLRRALLRSRVLQLELDRSQSAAGARTPPSSTDEDDKREQRRDTRTVVRVWCVCIGCLI
jgi:hypothetical protein